MHDGHGVVLLSTYELGHQPLGLASPLGFLRRVGYDAVAVDTSVSPLDLRLIEQARFVGFSVPMHTAMRIAVPLLDRIRAVNPKVHICCYGLYAHLNAEMLFSRGVDSVLAGESEEELVSLVDAVIGDSSLPHAAQTRDRLGAPTLRRLSFAVPCRDDLPPLNRYAALRRNGETVVTGYVEASRGCRHLCRHCPIPPVYGGRFFVVPRDVVLDDISQLVAAGARHITFGDPDFLNGPKHAVAVTEALHERFPGVTYDFTAKVEHILRNRALFPSFAATGCIFVVSAFESTSNEVLRILKKDHMREDLSDAVRILRSAGIAVRPTWVAFTPWTTRDDYLEMLRFIESEDLVDAVDPVQYALRLLIPPGSMLLETDEAQRVVAELEVEALSYRWTHPDSSMDAMQRAMERAATEAAHNHEDPEATFARFKRLAGVTAEEASEVHAKRCRTPYLTEPWFC